MHENLPVDFAWKFGCKGYPLKEWMNKGKLGILRGISCAKDAPGKGKRAGADKQGEMGEKVAEIGFLKLEIMRKMDISR